MKEHNICPQYYKDPKTGIEMNFRYSRGSGWGVSFPLVDVMDALDSLSSVEFPPSPKQYEQEEKEYYQRIKEQLLTNTTIS